MWPRSKNQIRFSNCSPIIGTETILHEIRVSTRDIIYHNLKKINQIKVGDKIFLGSNFLDWLQETERIKENVTLSSSKNHQTPDHMAFLDVDFDGKLSNVLGMILNHDCVLFNKIYRKVARYIGLEYFDNGYKLIFRKRSFSV